MFLGRLHLHREHLRVNWKSASISHRGPAFGKSDLVLERAEPGPQGFFDGLGLRRGESVRSVGVASLTPEPHGPLALGDVPQNATTVGARVARRHTVALSA